MPNSNIRLAIVLTLTAVSGRVLDAKDKRPKAETAKPQDQIVIEAHITVGGGPIIRFIATRHYDRSYIYAERDAGKSVTLIDVTNLGHPQVLSDPGGRPVLGNLLAVAGTAALEGNGPAEKPPTSQTIRLMDYSDPANPKVTREFNSVTAVEKVGGGIILLANGEGIWILSQHFAEDPAVEKRYANKVIYGESMY
jgi:hypothetical protein